MTHHTFATRERCPACGGTASRILYRCAYDADPVRGYLVLLTGKTDPETFAPTTGEEYLVMECPSCGLLFQRDIPDPRLLHTIYEDWLSTAEADTYEHDYTLNEYATRAREILLLIRSFGTKPGRLRFLDVGMGWGSWCLMARSFGVQVAGIELAESRVRVARASGITALGWDDLAVERFDVINADQIFEHLPEPFDALRRIHGALREGGIVALNVPDGRRVGPRLQRGDRPVAQDFRGRYNPVAPLEHINCFTHGSLMTLARRAGFERWKPPLGLQYRSLVLGNGPRRVLKDLARPLYYALGSPTAILLRKARGQAS